MSRDKLSSDSLRQASESIIDYSGHEDAAGTGGYKEDALNNECDHLSGAGQTKIINMPKDGFKKVHIGLAWNNIVTEQAQGFFSKLMKKAMDQGVDLDLGCLYELKDGTRGCIQAFGEKFGNYDKAPYIKLSGDERTGDAEGDDEILTINGTSWDKIDRVLIYCYIYEGPTLWNDIAPELTISMDGDDLPIKITPTAHRTDINICALAKIRNEKGAMHFTNHTEYFHDHAAMDRAYGFGLQWGEGTKD